MSEIKHMAGAVTVASSGLRYMCTNEVLNSKYGALGAALISTLFPCLGSLVAPIVSFFLIVQ
jgi:hypothetical protein